MLAQTARCFGFQTFNAVVCEGGKQVTPATAFCVNDHLVSLLTSATLRLQQQHDQRKQASSVRSDTAGPTDFLDEAEPEGLSQEAAFSAALVELHVQYFESYLRKW